jgi:hypothetical protein
MGYVMKEVEFFATGTSTTVQFSSTTSGAFGPVIDNVRLDDRQHGDRQSCSSSESTPRGNQMPG